MENRRVDAELSPDAGVAGAAWGQFSLSVEGAAFSGTSLSDYGMRSREVYFVFWVPTMTTDVWRTPCKDSCCFLLLLRRHVLEFDGKTFATSVIDVDTCKVLMVPSAATCPPAVAVHAWRPSSFPVDASSSWIRLVQVRVQYDVLELVEHRKGSHHFH